LVGAPNTIEEDIIKQTMDKEFKELEQKLLLSSSYKMDYLCSGSEIPHRDALGRNQREEAETRNKQCQASIHHACSSARPQKDANVISLHKRKGRIAQTLGERSLHDRVTKQEELARSKD
jgi:hypothetical protein